MDTIGDAFTRNYTAMQGNQRANRQLTDEEAQQLAMQHYHEATIAHQQAQLAWEQNPQNPDYMMKRAHADYYGKVLPNQLERTERTAASREAVADTRAKASELNRAGILISTGVPVDLATMGFDQDMLDTVKTNLVDRKLPDRQKKYQAARTAWQQNQELRQNKADELNALLTMNDMAPLVTPPVDSKTGKAAVQSGVAGARGLAFGIGGGAPAADQQSPTDWIGDAIGKTLNATPAPVEHPGEPPTRESVWNEIASQPYVTPQQQALIDQRKATENYRNSQAQRLAIQSEYIPQTMAMKEGLLQVARDRQAMQERIAKSGSFYQQGQLNARAVEDAIKDRLATTKESTGAAYVASKAPDYKDRRDAAALARSFAMQEHAFALREVSHLETAYNAMKAKQAALKAYLPQVNANGQYVNSQGVVVDPARTSVNVGTVPIMVSQLQNLIKANEIDLDRVPGPNGIGEVDGTNPDSLRGQLAAAKAKVEELGRIKDEPGLDRAPVLKGGKTAPLGPRSTPGATGGSKTADELWNKLHPARRHP